MNADHTMYSLTGQRVWVAGHRGMVGSALVRRLAGEQCRILTATHRELDLRDPAAVNAWVAANRPEAVFLAAARVGGILANVQSPADFLHDNLMIEANVIAAAHRFGVRKLLFLGSSSVYPRDASQPIPESALLTGVLDPANETYALAKIVGVKLCQAYRAQHGADFISAMPANIYGPGANLDPTAGQVIPSLIRRAHEAKRAGDPEMDLWGTGQPRREFLYVDDCADALVHLMRVHSGPEQVNIGSSQDVTIAEVARIVIHVVGYRGQIRRDLTKPDGAPRKLMSSDTLRSLGWMPTVSLEAGIQRTYDWFLQLQETG